MGRSRGNCSREDACGGGGGPVAWGDPVASCDNVAEGSVAGTRLRGVTLARRGFSLVSLDAMLVRSGGPGAGGVTNQLAHLHPRS